MATSAPHSTRRPYSTCSTGRFDYDDEIREILKQFGTDETAIDEDHVLDYLQTRTTEIDLNEVVEQWRGDLVAYGLDQLAEEGSDPND